MAGPAGVVLVTGGGRRIGRAITLELAAAGYDVAIHYHRSGAAATATAGEVRTAGRRAVTLAANLADEAAAAELLPRAARELGPVTVVVNNAAVFDFDRPDSVTAEGWARHMAINLRAPFVLIQALRRQLPEDGGGHAINLIDQRVWNITPNYTSYTVSKYALWGMTRHLALALAPRIRVNAIGPGLAAAPEGAADAFERLERVLPLGRGTSPEEIARAARYLLDSPSVTGQMLALDGGFHLGWLHPGQT